MPLHRPDNQRDIVRSANECLARSRRLLSETGDMVDPIRAGRPLKRPKVEPETVGD
jgi:hypothetical protein